MGLRAESRCASDGQPGSNKRSPAAERATAIVFDSAPRKYLQLRHSLTVNRPCNCPLSVAEGSQSERAISLKAMNPPVINTTEN